MTLQGQIRQVAAQRHLVCQLTDEYDRERKAWQESHAELCESYDTAKADLMEQEQTLRDTVVPVYQQTGNKAPAPGVGVRIITELAYEPAQALDWAKSHEMALALDKRAFESIAKVQCLEFVRRVMVPQATIATNLDKALAETQ